MKRLMLAAALAMAMAATGCRAHSGCAVSVYNPSGADRAQMVEVNKDALPQGPVKILDADGAEVPSQLTYDNKLIFMANVPAGATVKYTVAQGEPLKPQTTACGKVYPNRDDDIAWENDLVAFRAYGPNIQRKGERMYGYDLFLKRDTAGPVLQDWYDAQCSGDNWRKVNTLRSEGKNGEADIFVNSFTYHVDHGHGMDCYAVGATLGAGATALIGYDGIAYPWCYDKAEILDNGPLRFTARLTYKPSAVRRGADPQDTDTVVEQRVITLDAGSHLNRTEVTYSGLSVPCPLIAGIAVRDAQYLGKTGGGKQERYISYLDPTQGTDNGQVYVGAVFPLEPEYVGIVGDKTLHLAAGSVYEPGQTYTYYWGYGWDRADVPSLEAWNAMLAAEAAALEQPLQVTIK